ncbi:hypothetical protein VKT23_002378 [Stygiomarasmius scandens]|uniref:Uncharacterized protein n=1 Tax=Marasmiellus scandens TaxID=2682957 RepID=A0ABR1K217_9AGAR
MGIQEVRVQGGAFPIWLENAPICPVAVVACYSGSSQDDHSLVVTSVRDYLNKMLRNSEAAPSMPAPSVASAPPPRPETRSVSSRHDSYYGHHAQSPTSWQDWNLPEVTTVASEYTRPETPYDGHDEEH